MTAHAQRQASAQVSETTWLIEEGDAGCSMSRRLSGSPGATLVLQSMHGGSQYSLALASRDWPTAVESADRIRLDLQPVAASWEGTGGITPGERGVGDSVWFESLPADFLHAFAGATTMTITADGRPVATLNVPPAAGAARAFAVCEAAVRGQ